jgi:hypothetical protein
MFWLSVTDMRLGVFLLCIIIEMGDFPLIQKKVDLQFAFYDCKTIATSIYLKQHPFNCINSYIHD